MIRVLIVGFFVIFALNANSTKEFKIIEKDMLTDSLVTIGNAFFTDKSVNFEGKKAILYTIELKFNDMGNIETRSFENLCYFDSLEPINYRYSDGKGLKISALRVKNEIYINAILNEKMQVKNKYQYENNAIASSILYVKLARMLDKNEKSFEYISINEDEYKIPSILRKGRVLYQGIEEVEVVSQKKKLHVFVNSDGLEQSFIYFTPEKSLYAIKLIKPGSVIVLISSN